MDYFGKLSKDASARYQSGRITRPMVMAVLQTLDNWSDDVTAPDNVTVEHVTSPAGHKVLYVHVDGVTRLRVCRHKTLCVELEGQPPIEMKS